MEHQLTITLPDEVFQPLVEVALRQGRTLEELAAERLASTVTARKTSDAVAARLAEERFARHIGAFDSGDPNSADNERIDADLERAYSAEPSLAELFGSVDLGRPTGADNESIDRDLAREYGATHEEVN
jgi:hypothetical protein